MSITILPKLIPDKYNPAIQIDSNNFNASNEIFDSSNEILQFIIYDIQWSFLIVFFILFL